MSDFMQDRFTRVYGRKLGADGPVLSGPLASPTSCVELIAWLDAQAGAGLRSVLDLGCGDLEWISRCPAVANRRLAYFGVDVVPRLIAHHRRVFPWFRGEAAELEEYCLTRRMKADLIILKDVLPYNCPGAAGDILLGIGRADYRLLLISSDPGADNPGRRGARNGVNLAPYDVEAAVIEEGIRDPSETGTGLGEIIRRFRRPDGGQWIVYSIK